MTQENGAGRRPRLLLVEDDRTTRELIRHHLESREFDVNAVDAAEEGIVEAGEVAFDVVVADIHLPGLSGIELAGFLLEQDPDLPVILITGDPDETLAASALAQGPIYYLMKPFAPAELESAVRQALVGRGWSMSDGELVEGTVRGLRVPAEWLEFVDQESYAGPGHGERTARIAFVLLEGMASASRDVNCADVSLAARTHEVGRLRAPDAEPAAVAVESAELMAEAGFPRPAVRAVRHMHERWDGRGGPDCLQGANIPLAAQILAVADAIDHYASAWIQVGLNGDNAVDRAIHLVTAQQTQAFSPVVVGALHRRTEEVREICTAPRPESEQSSLTTASFSEKLAQVPFQAA